MDVDLENIIVIGVTVGLAVVLLLLIRWLVPKYLRRFLRWVDEIIPADLSDFVRPVSRFFKIVLGLVVLLTAGLIIASQLGADLIDLRNGAGDSGAVIGRWLGTRILTIGLIVVVAITVIRVVKHVTAPLIQQYLTRRGDPDEQSTEIDKRTRTLQGVVSNTLTVGIVTVAFFMILAELGINIAPILAGAGVVGIAIGFGAQSLIRDLISGIFIMLEDQYRVGDVARVAGVAGLVEDINLRRTTLRDLDYIQHIIPNGEIRVASNFTKEKSRVNLNIEVAYKEDLDHVMDVIRKVGAELAEDPEFGPLITDPIKPLRVDNFGESGIAIKVLGETKPIQQWTVAGEFRRRLKRAFDEEGIEIPFPHRTLYWGTDVETRIRRLMDLREEESRQSEEAATLTEDGTEEK
ncbi:MAG: mechanosensitive ion channel family protein [Dehalococcoidia bacterium]